MHPSDRTGRDANQRRTGIAVLATILLHGLLFGLWQLAVGPASTPTQNAPAWRLRLEAMPLLPGNPPPPQATIDAPRPMPRIREAARRTRSTMVTRSTAAKPPEPAAHASPVPAGNPQPPAAGPEPALLDTAAARRAIREAAGAHDPAARAVAAGIALQAPSAAQRLAQEMAASGRGDCEKGEYLGAGAGLLSLPFLAAAALRGHCAK